MSRCQREPRTPEAANKSIRNATAAVVVAVAAFAAVISYQHIYFVARHHGQDGSASGLLPLSVDGLILAASLVMLHESRAGRDTPHLTRFALWLGIVVTVAANVGYGVPFGIVGALVSAWPALSFVLAVEMLMGLVRRSRSAPVAQPETAPEVHTAPGSGTVLPAVPEPVPAPEAQAHPERTRTRTRKRAPAVPVTARDPLLEFAAEVASGTAPSVRQIRTRMHVGQDRAYEILGDLEKTITEGMAMASNGNGMQHG